MSVDVDCLNLTLMIWVLKFFRKRQSKVIDDSCFWFTSASCQISLRNIFWNVTWLVLSSFHWLPLSSFFAWPTPYRSTTALKVRRKSNAIQRQFRSASKLETNFKVEFLLKDVSTKRLVAATTTSADERLVSSYLLPNAVYFGDDLWTHEAYSLLSL